MEVYLPIGRYLKDIIPFEHFSTVKRVLNTENSHKFDLFMILMKISSYTSSYLQQSFCF